MTTAFWTQLEAELVRDEGDREFPYQDAKGQWTIGIGHDLSANGISPAVRDLLFKEDVDRALNDALTFSWFIGLNDVRQRVVLNMLFNLGRTKFMGFVHMLAAIERQDYLEASRQMLMSDWAGEVHDRATRLAAHMETGCDQ